MSGKGTFRLRLPKCRMSKHLSHLFLRFAEQEEKERVDEETRRRAQAPVPRRGFSSPLVVSDVTCVKGSMPLEWERAPPFI